METIPKKDTIIILTDLKIQMVTEKYNTLVASKYTIQNNTNVNEYK